MREPRNTFDDEELQAALDDSETTSPGGVQGHPQSLEPGDEICQPVKVERARRKFVDDGIFRRLTRIQKAVEGSIDSIEKNRKIQRLTAIGVLTMVVFAALEYMGIMGPGGHPIWARAVIDGLSTVLGIPK